MSSSFQDRTTSLDPTLIVERWRELLDARPTTALAAGVVERELRRLAQWLEEAAHTDGRLSPRVLARIAQSGEHLVDLGIDDPGSLASAQGALVGWLAARLDNERLALFAEQFGRGALNALERRQSLGAAARAEKLEARLEARAGYAAIAYRLERDLGAVEQQEESLIGATLAILQRELRCTGLGYFEWLEGRWHPRQTLGSLPRPSLVQPRQGEPVPRFADGVGHRASAETIEVAAPVPIDDRAPALLFVVLGGARRESDAILEMMRGIGGTLGARLSRAALRELLDRQLDEMRTLSTEERRRTWGRGALQRLALLVDESDTPRPLEVLPPTAEHENRLMRPLAVRGNEIGTLMLECERPQGWGEEEIELIDAVVEQMGQALESARLFKEAERRGAQLAAAAEVSRAASSLLSLDRLMETAVEQIRQTFGYYHAQVFLIDESGQWATLRSSTGEAGAKLLARQHRLEVGSQSVIGQVTATAAPVVARDTGRSDVVWRYNDLLPETRAELAVPLRVGSQVIGALDVQSVSPDVFEEDDIAVLQTLADQMAVAIQNARAFEHQRESAEQLRELDQLKSQFLANMSHELRTPLNSIIGFSRVILKGIDGPITELQEKDLNTIHSSGQILLQLIDSILDISKIEAGKMELEFEPVELGTVIDIALSTASGLVRDKPVELVREIPDQLPTIRADGVRLRQVLLNLLSNAAKFTEEGFVRLTATQAGDEVLISVSDSGVGIPSEKQENLFEAFYQVDGSATRRVGGTGLGLAISRSFVEMHGGQIWVESAGVPGEGSTFHVSLPIGGPPAERGSDEPPLVLAVDDEPGITALYDKYLVPEGFRVEGCHEPMDAISLAAALRPQLILLDLRMPGMDGFEVLEALRDNLLTREIPVVLCSIEETGALAEEARAAGAVDLLQKPILRQDLVTLVRRVTGS